MFPKNLLLPLALLPLTALQAQEVPMDHSAAPMGMSPIPIAGQSTVPQHPQPPPSPPWSAKWISPRPGSCSPTPPSPAST